MRKILGHVQTAVRLWVLSLLYEIVFITPLDTYKRLSPALGLYLLSALSLLYLVYPSLLVLSAIAGSYLYILFFSRRPPRLSIEKTVYRKILRDVLNSRPENLVLLPVRDARLARALIECLIILTDKIAPEDVELSNKAIIHAYVVWFESARRRGLEFIKMLTKIPPQ